MKSQFDSDFGRSVRHGLLLALLGGSLVGSGIAQTVTSGTDTVTTQAADTLTPEQEAALAPSAEAEEATQTVLLLGEKVSVESAASEKGPFPDLVGYTTSTLGGRVTDKTRHGALISAVADEAAGLFDTQPDIVIVFTGYADGKANTADDVQLDALKKIITGATQKGARVILVPSSTEVGAMVSANMRIAASDFGASFVPMGTEVSGRPFDEAFEGIKLELAGEEPEAEAATAKSNPTSVTIKGGKLQEPTVEAVNTDEYKQRQVSLQQELNRVAGQADELEPISTTDTELADEKVYEDTGTTATHTGYPDGGTLTKRGPEARESINMRPLPAVKAFRPQIPVPRVEIHMKEPGLSR